MTRILHTADLHGYPHSHDWPGEGGLSQRFLDWRRSLDHVARTAMDCRADAVVVAGDLFCTKRPRQLEVIAMVSFLQELSGHGIPAFIIPGNHDWVSDGEPGSVELIDACRIPGVHCFTRPGQAIVREVQLWFLPVPSRSEFMSSSGTSLAAHEIGPEMASALEGLISAMPAEPEWSNGLQHVLVTHVAVQSARTPADQSILATQEPVLSDAALIGAAFDAVLLGHIHRAQVISERPWVGYSGPIERAEFGEEAGTPGFWILDLEDTRVSARFVPTPARRFQTLDLDLRATASQENVERALARLEVAEDAVVRVRYKATEASAKLVDHRALTAALVNAGAARVAGIYPEVERAVRARDVSVTESLTPARALERWVEAHPELLQAQSELRAAAETLLREVVAP